MTKLLGIISLILALVLFPPAALALVSNNAIPGDATYPVKRGLEDVIYAVASLNPATKAWFAKARSDRRFQEIKILITQGKKASETLSELVEQAQVAASQIEKISDPVEKEKFINQLSNSITKYDQGLAQVLQSPVSPPAFSPVPSSVDIPVFSAPTPTPALVPSNTPLPSVTPAPSVAPLPSVKPRPTPSPSGQNDIDKAREELDKIKEQLEKQRQRHGEEQENKSKEQKGEHDKDQKQDKQDKSNDRSSKKGKD